MKALPLAAILTLTVLAGCLGGSDEPDEPHTHSDVYQGDGRLLVESLKAPEGAKVVLGEAGPVLEWLGASLPFTTTFELPAGASMVRFLADPGDAGTVSVAMWNDETGRRRCNQQTVDGFGQTFLGERSCSSIAAVDLPGTNWTARATGTGTIDARIEFHSAPVDGPAAGVNWDLLSKATHDIQPTSGQYITAHDGAQLWVEVTLPSGEGPWPTVIAASPYNGQSGRIPDPGEGSGTGGTPAMWTYWTQDYAKRGYAAVNIDVRGFGKSGGCVEVWGINEQLDQKLIVDWVADQAWSDGTAGFYGQSYVATTPVAAAVQTPDALKAIIAVAPVIDAYHDWHFGGVPNGESSLSPVAYQALTDMLGTNYVAGEVGPDDDLPTDLVHLLQYSTQGICNPTLVPLANDPRAIHGAYYDERDFGARAGDIEAAVLFTQGFEDANVKSAMIPDWFNAIGAPKLGVFGHWLHQHPARMDAEALFLGWMDEFVKGKDLGIADAYPDAVVSADRELRRNDDAWPPMAEERFLGVTLAMDVGVLADGPGSGTVELDLTPVAPIADANPATGFSQFVASYPVEGDLPLVDAAVALDLTLTGENAFIHATLEEVMADGRTRFLTEGWKNLALGDDVDTYEPLLGAGRFIDELPLRETELIVAAGSILRLTVSGAQAGDALGVAQPQPATATFHGEGTGLVFPDITLDAYEPIGLTALP